MLSIEHYELRGNPARELVDLSCEAMQSTTSNFDDCREAKLLAQYTLLGVTARSESIISRIDSSEGEPSLLLKILPQTAITEILSELERKILVLESEELISFDSTKDRSDFFYTLIKIAELLGTPEAPYAKIEFRPSENRNCSRSLNVLPHVDYGREMPGTSVLILLDDYQGDETLSPRFFLPGNNEKLQRHSVKYYDPAVTQKELDYIARVGTEEYLSTELSITRTEQRLLPPRVPVRFEHGREGVWHLRCVASAAQERRGRMLIRIGK